jgi:hypothetical protein
MKLSEEEHQRLTALYKTAQTTPVIKLTSNPNEKDWATAAWDKVREYMDELGRKYGYDPAKYAINKDGEVVPHENPA